MEGEKSFRQKQRKAGEERPTSDFRHYNPDTQAPRRKVTNGSGGPSVTQGRVLDESPKSLQERLAELYSHVCPKLPDGLQKGTLPYDLAKVYGEYTGSNGNPSMTQLKNTFSQKRTPPRT